MTQQYKWIELAFDSINTEPIYQELGTKDTINTSSIATFLIQNVGRFCERYASDFLITWNSLTEYIDEPLTTNDDCKFFTFAIRKHGVDGNEFLMARINEWYNRYELYRVQKFYRHIYVVKIEKQKSNIDKTSTNDIIVTLQEITNCIKYQENKGE